MSRIGKKPVAVPKGVKVEQHQQTVKVTGPLGSAELSHDPCLTVKIEDSGSRIDVINPSRRCAAIRNSTARRGP